MSEKLEDTMSCRVKTVSWRWWQLELFILKIRLSLRLWPYCTKTFPLAKKS